MVPAMLSAALRGALGRLARGPGSWNFLSCCVRGRRLGPVLRDTSSTRGSSSQMWDTFRKPDCCLNSQRVLQNKEPMYWRNIRIRGASHRRIRPEPGSEKGGPERRIRRRTAWTPNGKVRLEWAWHATYLVPSINDCESARRVALNRAANWFEAIMMRSNDSGNPH